MAIKRIQLRYKEAIEMLRQAMKKRKQLKLNTQRGREKFLNKIVQDTDLWGTNVENYFRLKALCVMKGVERLQ